MILGTVQFGKPYGISNSSGMPGKKLVFQMLDTAYEHGVRMLDTGPMYGVSESVIGSYLKENGRRFQISTKLPDQIPDESGLVPEAIAAAVRQSLQKLHIEKISCYYLHQFSHCRCEAVLHALVNMRKEGLIENTGVSIYHPEELLYICRYLQDTVDAVQIPLNIFSVFRWIDALKAAQGAGIAVYARSIFLQGLAFLPPDHAFLQKRGAAGHVRYVQELARRRKTSIEQTCYDAVAAIPAVTDILTGAETMEQLLKNLKLESDYAPFSDSQIQETDAVMRDIPLDILNPQTWNQNL